MGREFELKYASESPAVLDAIEQAVAGEYHRTEMASTYYDTPNGALSARRWTLRLRREGAASVVTFKTAGDGRTRGEWEYEAPDLADCAARLCALGAPEELGQLLAGGVMPVCGAEFTRRAALLCVEGAALELALDTGRLFREDREMPLCEAEVELKAGSEAVCRRFAATLAEQFHLREEPLSKFVRAVNL